MPDDERFVMLPIAVLNDDRISGGAVRAFGVLLDCSRKSESRIGFDRLGERLHVSRQSARRIIRELIDAGHVQNIETVNGLCPNYKILTHITGGTGTGIRNGTGTGTKTYTGTGIKYGSDPYQNGRGTRISGDTHSIRPLNISLEDGLEKRADDEGHDPRYRLRLKELLASTNCNEDDLERASVTLLERLWRAHPDQVLDHVAGAVASGIDDVGQIIDCVYHKMIPRPASQPDRMERVAS